MVYCQLVKISEAHIVSVRGKAKDSLSLSINTHSSIRHTYKAQSYRSAKMPAHYGFKYYIN